MEWTALPVLFGIGAAGSAVAPALQTRLMDVAHGAQTRCTNALGAALDREEIDFARKLLEAGYDVDEGAVVAQAVRRGRGPDFVELLAKHGADLDRPGGETWRGDVPLRTPYAHAVIRGKEERVARKAVAANPRQAPS